MSPLEGSGEVEAKQAKERLHSESLRPKGEAETNSVLLRVH